MASTKLEAWVTLGQHVPHGHQRGLKHARPRLLGCHHATEKRPPRGLQVAPLSLLSLPYATLGPTSRNSQPTGATGATITRGSYNPTCPRLLIIDNNWIMSDSSSSSSSSVSDSPADGSSEPKPMAEQAISSKTDDLTPRDNVEDVEASPEAESLHITWTGAPVDSSGDESVPQPSISVDFVVVHGIFGKCTPESAAGPGSGSSEWVATYAESLNSESRILRFEYDASRLLSGRRSREAIRTHALNLLRALSAVRKNQIKKRLITFVAHDIGGVIVKDALAAAVLDRTSWMDLFEMARTLVFIGCPHRSINRLDMEDRLSRFLFSEYRSASVNFRPSVASIPGLAAAVVEVNGLFIESKVPLRSKIISIHATSDQQYINLAFDRHCATLGVSLESRIAESPYDDSSLTGVLAKIETDLNIEVDPEHLRYERRLLSIASPIYPFRGEGTNNFLAGSSQYDSWLEHKGAKILYIYGTSRVREAAEQAFHNLDELVSGKDSRTIVLYFSFDRWDVRCDSIKDMLSTFLAQIICHYPHLAGRTKILSTLLHNGRGWTEADLIYWFERFRFTDEIEHVMCVINYFDECTKGSRKPFLDNFARVSQATERPWKVVITSHRPGALLDELAGPSCINLDLTESGVEIDDGESIDGAMKRLVTLRPELQLQDKTVRDQLQQLENLDPLLRFMLCEQASVRQNWPDEISINQIYCPPEATSIQTQDDQTLQETLDRVFKGIPEQTTFRRLLSWILYSVRPLSIWELATVAYVGSDEDREGLAKPPSSTLESFITLCQNWFAGIAEMNQNEMKITNPRLRNILMGKAATKSVPGKPRFIWDEVKETAHHDIANLCIDYLSRPSVSNILDETFQFTEAESFETPIFADRGNLCSYAIQAWAHHFLLCFNRPELSLLQSQSNFPALSKIWAKGYWALSNFVTRSPTCGETLFPIFAGLGVLDVIRPRDEPDARRGLLEAASRGQAKTVQLLLERLEFKKSILLDTLVAAAAHGEEDMLLGVLDYLMSNSGDGDSIAWPPVLMHRAAWLGLDRFAKKLLEFGCPADPVVEWTKIIMATPLHHAARNFHPECVRVLINHKADVNFRAIYDRTSLHIVAGQGHAEITKILLEEGKVEMEATDVDGVTALYLASLWGHHQAVKTLLEMGADPNMGIESGVMAGKWSPLVVAAEDGFEQCVQLLLSNKADPNLSGPFVAGTALRHAAVKGHMDVCRILVAHGADLNSSMIDPPILTQIINDYDANRDQLEMFDLFLELGAEVNAKGSDGVPVLIQAINKEENHAFARRLLDREETDVNLLDSDNNGALYHAAEKGHQALVELLLEKKANVNQVSTAGETPLYYAVPKPEIVHVLLKNGADPDLGVCRGFTALMFAAWYSHTTTIEHLLKHNAAVDLEFKGEFEDFKGWTALMFAATYGSEEVVRILAENGANLEKKSAAGVPVIHAAAWRDTLSGMLEFPSKIDLNQVNHDGSSAIHLDIPIANFKRLVNAGAKLEIQDTVAGDTPLTYAASSNQLDRAEYLLKRGVDINLSSPCNGAPLHQACRASNLDMMKLLIEHGADPNYPCDGIPGTPIQAVLTRYNTENPHTAEELIEYLIAQGADVTATGGLMRFPINAAALMGTPTLISRLLDCGAKIDVMDHMGRAPIHAAAFHGIDNFQVIVDLGGDINRRDETGRTALHWAAEPGRSQVVEMILSSTAQRQFVDAPDIDGWTPLCWAARGTDSWLNEEMAGEPQDQMKVIKLLLDNGADRSIVVSAAGQKWTPVKIARFSGQSAEVIDILKHGLASDNVSKEIAHSNPPEELAERDEDRSRAANIRTSYCDACRCNIRGFAYHCNTCLDFDLCFKCYPHRRILHSYPDHSFEARGPEFEDLPDADDSDTSDTSASSDSESDSGS
ncbi:hypothetical protein QQS21_006571 [Conoideocrella luteorostrata]|uniref:Peptidase A2 domain-containing protein n=1 Tax=Conoideocrella luteorostrata TaxID=1105319 RepID=A0AAJ0CQC2_9HYPO|nr:hypothetical protein QQS21_006571 [Conoideocrella luteorostrata]